MIDRRITIRGIIFKDGKIFAQQLKPTIDGIPRDFWCTPGGGLESEETLMDGLKREIFEETGIRPTIGRLLFVQQFNDGKKYENLEFFFNIENVDDFASIDLSKTSHGDLEIKNYGFIDPKKFDLKPDFLKNIDYQEYIENNKPVIIASDLK